MKYKVRCSELSTLLDGCGKVKNKLEWDELDKMNDSHIKLAIKIYNKVQNRFEPADVDTLDMRAGTLQEKAAFQMYDEHFGTNFANYQKERLSNDWIEGERDAGDNSITIDCKISTDKNVFDAKRFAKTQDVGYIIQLNGYGWLYNTPKLQLFNALMPPLPEQIDKMVRDKLWACKLDLIEEQAYRDKLESSYFYDFYPVKSRIQTHDIPVIENFQEIVKKRVEIMNEWIDKNMKGY